MSEIASLNSYIDFDIEHGQFKGQFIFPIHICIKQGFTRTLVINGIFLPKLFWPTVRKNCSSDREKLLKFEAEGRDFSNILRSLEQFIRTVKGQNNFW